MDLKDICQSLRMNVKARLESSQKSKEKPKLSSKKSKFISNKMRKQINLFEMIKL
jgi:hypothetical protein